MGLLLFTFCAAVRYDMHKFHCQLVAQCMYLVCNTALLHVSAKHFGLLQGVTNLMDVNIWQIVTDVWDTTLHTLARAHTHTHTHTHILHLYYTNVIFNTNLHAQCAYSRYVLAVPKCRIFRSSLRQKKHRCLDIEHYC